jgi:predicted lipoprotein
MKKVCKYTVAAAIITFLLYPSIYFEKLDKVKERQRRGAFNAAEYARDFWDNQLFTVLDRAVDVKELIELFNTNMTEAVRKYGKAPGVSRVYAYLLRGEGKILKTGENCLEVSVREPRANPDVLIATGLYIPGNAVRDASGLIDVSEFSDTMKFNEISGEINKIVVREVIRPLRDKYPRAGMTIRFFGAAQVAQDAAEEHLFGQSISDTAEVKEFQLVSVVPIKLELK